MNVDRERLLDQHAKLEETAGKRRSAVTRTSLADPNYRGEDYMAD